MHVSLGSGGAAGAQEAVLSGKCFDEAFVDTADSTTLQIDEIVTRLTR